MSARLHSSVMDTCSKGMSDSMEIRVVFRFFLVFLIRLSSIIIYNFSDLYK